MQRDFYHTGLQVGRSDLRLLLDAYNPAKRYFVKGNSGVARPVSGVYESGSDNNDGLTWDTAFATISKAISVSNSLINWSASPWAPNTEIHIAPGKYTESLSSMPYGSALIGHGDAFDADGERGVRIRPDTSIWGSLPAVNVTSVINCRIENINFQTSDAAAVFVAANFNNNQVIHCSFQGAPEATTSVAGMQLTDAVSNLWRDCQFFYLDCGIDWTAGGGPTSVRNWIDRCMFSFISEAGIRLDATTVVPITHITDCNFDGGTGTLALGIDDNTGDVHVYNTNFEATACDPASGAGHYNNCYLNGVLMT